MIFFFFHIFITLFNYYYLFKTGMNSVQNQLFSETEMNVSEWSLLSSPLRPPPPPSKFFLARIPQTFTLRRLSRCSLVTSIDSREIKIIKMWERGIKLKEINKRKTFGFVYFHLYLHIISFNCLIMVIQFNL